MPPVNNFLPFAPTDTGTNLLSQSDYAAAADRTIGNQPGVASSKLVNKAARQSAYIASQFAQFLANQTGTDLLDDSIPAKLLSQISASIQPIAPSLTTYLSSSGSHNLSYIFYIASGSATAGATYTNNSVTFTVKKTVASGTQITMSGAGAPSVSGTLTKTLGVGDSTLTFYATRAPLYLKVKLNGAGGGGGGSTANPNNNGGTGADGGDTTFGTTLLVGSGGAGGIGTTGSIGGVGGAASLGTGPIGVAFQGAQGGYGKEAQFAGLNVYLFNGGFGGATPFGGSSPGSALAAAGSAPTDNTGSGGGGAGSGSGGISGAGGGAGGFVDCLITAPLSTYAYSVGNGGAGGTAGTGGQIGGAGAKGIIIVEECYQ